MAVHRKVPTCQFCGKETFKAIYKKRDPFNPIIGDSFIRWEDLNHSCPTKKKYEKEYKQRPDVIEGKKKMKSVFDKLFKKNKKTDK